MKDLFIAGTGTGVGKTRITGMLARYLQEQGLDVVTQKPVQTGSAKYPGPDLSFHWRMMKHLPHILPQEIPFMIPYLFKWPASPHLAAEAEGKEIRPAVIEKAYRALSRKHETVLIEGAGGLMVPLNRKTLFVDWVKKMNLPILLVAENKLGGINHTLLSLEALHARKIKVLGIVFNEAAGQDKGICRDNPRIVEQFCSVAILGHLPRQKNPNRLYEKFKPIGEKILSAMEKTRA